MVMDRQTLIALVALMLIAVNCFAASAFLAETTAMRAGLIVVGTVPAVGVLLYTRAYYRGKNGS